MYLQSVKKEKINKMPTSGLLSNKNCNIALDSESPGLKYEREREVCF